MKYLNNFNNFLILEKTELKYSITALNNMLNLHSDKMIEIPFKEVVYLKSKVISGLIILDIFNKLYPKNFMFRFRDMSSSGFFEYDFYEQPKISQEEQLKLKTIIDDSFKGKINWNLDNILNQNMELMFKMVETFEFKAEFSEFHWSLNFNKLYDREGDKRKILIHELRHLTQYINSNLIKIANNWIEESKKSDNLGNLLKRSLFKGTNEYYFGRGKTKNIKTPDSEELTYMQNYLLFDVEYKPWMFDLIDKSIEETNAKNLDYNTALKKTWDWLLNNDKFNHIRKYRKEAAKDYWLHLQNKLKELK